MNVPQASITEPVKVMNQFRFHQSKHEYVPIKAIGISYTPPKTLQKAASEPQKPSTIMKAPAIVAIKPPCNMCALLFIQAEVK